MILDDNASAQQHAELLIRHNIRGHWGVDGLGARRTADRGTGQGERSPCEDSSEARGAVPGRPSAGSLWLAFADGSRTRSSAPPAHAILADVAGELRRSTSCSGRPPGAEPPAKENTFSRHLVMLGQSYP